VPNFWPIGNGKHMLLLFSHKRAGQYYVGDYDRNSHRFIPDRHGRMNYGPIGVGSLHAPSATVDDRGRFVAVFNVKEGRPSEGWNDVMTLPRHLSLDKDNALRIEPVAELESLRSDPAGVHNVEIPANGEVALDGIGGREVEIDALIEPGQAREVGLYVLRSPDRAERTRVSLFRNNDRSYGLSALQIDGSEASLRSDVFARAPETGPLALGEGEPLRMRAFVDRSIVEVFANGRQCLTLRVYPEKEESAGVSLFARGAPAKLVSLQAWRMQSI
jgi:beta-fructofuranosidase